jgi:hypothetical protein
MQMAGIPLAEMWTHVLAAENYVDRKQKLPAGSGYDELCGVSTKAAMRTRAAVYCSLS